MPRYKLLISYLGTGYHGWAKQKANPLTIQGILESIASQYIGHPVEVYGAGRTDAGVHATGQVAHVDLDRIGSRRGSDEPRQICKAFNSMLRPHAIRVNAVELAPPTFHARFSAVSRTYVYRILTTRATLTSDPHEYDDNDDAMVATRSSCSTTVTTTPLASCSPAISSSSSSSSASTSSASSSSTPIPLIASSPAGWCAADDLLEQQRSWHVPLIGPAAASSMLDVQAMAAAAQQLEGTHDFSSFRGALCQSKTPIRTISRISIDSGPPIGQVLFGRRQGGQVTRVEITANAFLHHQVRNMVGALVSVGRRKLSPDQLGAILQAKSRALNPCEMAPAHGLFLTHVDYSIPN